MIKLVALNGVGDCYLVSALFRAFLDHRPECGPAAFVCKPEHEAIPLMFGIEPTLDAKLVAEGEQDQVLQQNHDNLPYDGNVVYLHPSFVRSGVRIDHLTAGSFVSQADMYRALLHIPMNAPLDQPKIPSPTLPDASRTVLLIPEARSWPNTQPAFWERLYRELGERQGWCVRMTDPNWSLFQLLDYAVRAEWVIGPQCGVMSVLTAGRFPCHKTFCTPSIPIPKPEGMLVDQTFPYGYVTKFDGRDYDVEEFEIADNNHDAIIQAILNGNNYHQARHHPQPVVSFQMPLQPGDFLDRMAVLLVKSSNFPWEKRRAIRRECERYVEVFTRMPCWMRSLIQPEVEELLAINQNIYTHSAELIPATIADNALTPELVQRHIRVIQLNKRRIELKSMIDQKLHSAYSEVKDYYNDSPA